MNKKAAYMKQALKLAKKGLFTTTVNPRVGCVLVKGGKVVGKGYHKRAGEAHAEVLAIKQAKKRAKGSTAYVTLEPCSHFGKNPPCADALIQAKVKKVIVCNLDPNPLVAGKGLAKIRAAGIKVEPGQKAEKGEKLNCGFFHRMNKGTPFVRLIRSNKTNNNSLRKSKKTHYWRARSNAILTDYETIINTESFWECSLKNVAKKYKKHPQDFDKYQPLFILIDPELKILLSSKLFKGVGKKTVFTSNLDKDKRKAFENKGIQVKTMPTKNNKSDFPALLKWLGEQQVNELLIQAGKETSNLFINQKLINQNILVK